MTRVALCSCIGILTVSTMFWSCASRPVQVAEQWSEVELVFEADEAFDNPYTAVEMHVDFAGPGESRIRRPAFWDGGKIWKVRFASPVSEGSWAWQSYCSNERDAGLHGKSGTLQAAPYRGQNPLIRRGLLGMSPGKRNVIHADGTPLLVVADTPWALPWRATVETAQRYAANRQARGFNAALLMSVQPDQDARGPRSRTELEGFDVGFEDLHEGHLNRLNPVYFQYFDGLVDILLEHGIVPVYQPVFQGYGWKGLRVLGRDAEPGEYARYCRYLVARFGARPAMWLVSGDNSGLDPCIEPAGEEVEAGDAYGQPTGIHYNPFDDYQPDFMRKEQCFHQNKAHQEKAWLDFQWCQTGHDGKHLPHKVSLMYDNQPTKAAANGEPTYEAMRDPMNGAGWWQGEEAWSQLTAGGTMGVVYGAAGLWQWKLAADEPGWPDWANAPLAWHQAMELEGSLYVGYVGRALSGMNFADMEKRPDLAGGKPCLAKPGEFYVVYLSEGGQVALSGLSASLPYRWFDPRQGEWGEEQVTPGETMTLSAPSSDPWVLVVGSRTPR
jgi:hypothetical protein